VKIKRSKIKSAKASSDSCERSSSAEAALGRVNSLGLSVPTQNALSDLEGSYRVSGDITTCHATELINKMELCSGNRTYVLAQMALIDIDIGEMQSDLNKLRYRIFQCNEDLTKWRVEQIYNADEDVIALQARVRELQGTYAILDALQEGIDKRHAVLSREITRRQNDL